jgi:imidazoleglycerol-phosphate dehydratase
MERWAEIKRKTSETDISLKLVLESHEKSEIHSGVPFFDHMLDAFAKHGHMHIELECRGDVEVDDHHSVEDVGICLGKALKKALGDRAGINRFGNATAPMDDALATAAVDVSGRAYFRLTGDTMRGMLNRYEEELTMEFLRSLAVNAEINLHVLVHYGDNRHHVHEAVFKAAGIALFRACRIEGAYGGDVPSTKGTLA